MAKKSDAGKKDSSTPKPKRVRQATLPRYTLREALTVAQAITDNFAGDPTPPHQVAMALDISPTSSIWRNLSGSAVAYGLTTGGYRADTIGLEELGQRCTAPTEEGDDVVARAEAALKPSAPRQFFDKYNRSRFPPDNIAKNVLQQTFDIPADRADDALALLKDDGAFVGFIHDTKTGPFVSTDDLSPRPVERHDQVVDDSDSEIDEPEKNAPEDEHVELTPPIVTPSANHSEPFKVFITHGKNLKILDQVKDVLDLYDIEYEVAIEEESPAIPVPTKVLSAMRRCGAGVMIVSADDDASAESGAINNNVLIEVGAAFVLYDQKVVLLWDKRMKVPSNLQGLYRCEFEGDALSFAIGTKLAKAVKGFKAA